VQCCVEILCNKCFPDIENGLRATPDDLGNLVVRFISMEQDIGMPDYGSSRSPAAGEIFEKRSLVIGKGNDILALFHARCILAISI
jgi:hypothetical protein